MPTMRGKKSHTVSTKSLEMQFFKNILAETSEDKAFFEELKILLRAMDVALKNQHSVQVLHYLLKLGEMLYIKFGSTEKAQQYFSENERIFELSEQSLNHLQLISDIFEASLAYAVPRDLEEIDGGKDTFFSLKAAVTIFPKLVGIDELPEAAKNVNQLKELFDAVNQLSYLRRICEKELVDDALQEILDDNQMALLELLYQGQKADKISKQDMRKAVTNLENYLKGTVISSSLKESLKDFLNAVEQLATPFFSSPTNPLPPPKIG